MSFHFAEQAITAFLKEMGLTAEELLARPQLVDAICEYLGWHA